MSDCVYTYMCTCVYWHFSLDSRLLYLHELKTCNKSVLNIHSCRSVMVDDSVARQTNSATQHTIGLASQTNKLSNKVTQPTDSAHEFRGQYSHTQTMFKIFTQVL